MARFIVFTMASLFSFLCTYLMALIGEPRSVWLMELFGVM